VTSTAWGAAGRLSNSGETVRLLNGQDEVVDEVQYADEGDWAVRKIVNVWRATNTPGDAPPPVGNLGTDPGLAADVTRAVKDATDKPVIVKLTPNAPDVVAVAVACEEAGADGLTAINTVLGMRIDVARRRPMLGTRSGGLSGPALRPIAVHLTYQVAQAVSIPIIGAGGVTSANDALEFLMAGASAVQVGTATFADPTAPLTVIEGLAAYVRAQGLASIRDIVGAALPRAR